MPPLSAVSTHSSSGASVERVEQPRILTSRSHLPRRPHGQLQHLAQCVQVRIPWPAVIRLPEIYAGLADTDLFSDFSNRQATLDPSVAQMAAQTWFARQC